MNLSHQLRHPVFQTISEQAVKLNEKAYVIGGFVRDLLLERGDKDIDIVCEGSGSSLAEAVATALGVEKVTVFKNFKTAMFRYQGYEIEFVGARKESYRAHSRKPIVEDGTLEEDQQRRDFTINALAISLNPGDFGEVVDPFGGLQDLEKKLLKTPLNPDITFSDDPLRMMRGVRFASELGFRIDSKALKAIRRNSPRLEIVSGERISTEFNRILLSPKPSLGLNLLFETRLLDQFLPELVKLHGVEVKNGIAHKDNFYHTLQVVDNVSDESNNLWLRWAALLHDIAKPETKRFFEGAGWTFHGHEDRGALMVPKIFKRLKLPLDHKMKYVQKLVLLHLRPIALTKEEATDSALRRLLFEAGDDLDDLMTLCKADITSKNEAKVKRYLENYERVKKRLVEVEEKDRIRNWQPPIDGKEIIETFQLKPGPEIGQIKNAIKDAILDGDIPNDYDAAYRFMVAYAEKLNLQIPSKKNQG
ncbi:MAG: HD domain-containing protein [Cryomorphaceae bacterium]|nr:MAG: HD domain-containing protein [Cryomorphaceae bacterium]